MTLEVVIHAGASKCGSSTIKQFLYSNAAALNEAGVALISSDDFKLRPGNSGVHLGSSPALDEFARTGASRTDMRQSLLRSLEHCEGAGRRMALIVAENALPTAPERAERYPLFFTDVIRNFSVRLAAYVRRPDEWLVSTWKQWGMKSEVPDLNAWLVRHCLRAEPSFGAGFRVWLDALGRAERVYCNILSPGSLEGGAILRDFRSRVLGNLPVALEETGDANVSPPAAWLQLLSESRATLFSGEHDVALERLLSRLIADDGRRERDLDRLLSAEGRLRIARIFRRDIQYLIDTFIADKASASKYFWLDWIPAEDEVLIPDNPPAMARFLEGAALPLDKDAVERAFRAVVLGAIRHFDQRLSQIAELVQRRADPRG